uniref:ENTH domain-containing protein n=1 Tax=Daucus carota subsp. sativus TaxID=79200 RepID=A0A164ZJK2_DAUCS
MPSTLTKAIGAVKDQTSISLAKVASSTSLEIAILKATTHDNVPVDERYVYEIVHLVSSHKMYARSCARAIGKRIGRTRNWIVALKSLLLVLRIFQDGDPYFPREVLHAMRRGAKILNLHSFRDDSNSRPWDYTTFVRMFALYLDERLNCFLTGKLQRRYTIKERDRNGRRGQQRRIEVVNEMKPPVLLDRITNWQRLLDRAIGTRPTGVASTNRLILISLYAVVEESFDLYRDISEKLALLLDGFFHLQYHLCVGAFEACVRASKQNEVLRQFYSYCLSLAPSSTSTYNPFLEEPGELAIVPSVAYPTAANAGSLGGFEPEFQTNKAFSAAPTFQATPAPTFQAATSTYSTQDSNENDPFSNQMFRGSISQQNLLSEQQLWLQQQNEIMAKHTA